MRRNYFLASCIVGFAASLGAFSMGGLFSRGKAEEIEVNDAGLPVRVLVATQGGAFKARLSRTLAERIGDMPAYARVADLSSLQTIDEAEWKAVVVIDSCESRRLGPYAAAFLSRVVAPGKVVLLVTSGSGRWRPAGCPVDCISTASRQSRIPSLASEILRRVEGGG